MNGAFGYVPKKTKKSTKKNPKVYSQTTSMEDIIKNKTIKHPEHNTTSFLRKLRKRIAKNG